TSSAFTRFSLRTENAASISRLVLALTISTCRPMADAAAVASLAIVSAMTEFFGLISTPKRVAFGSSSCNRPNRFAVISTFINVIPVRLPPGRFRLVTRPAWTGSLPVPKTIGIVLVAALASITAAVLCGATITATRRRTRSAANSGSRALLLCAQRNSIATLRPSANPVSPKPPRNADTRCAAGSGEPASIYPIIGTFVCCARAVSGHAAAAPPSAASNSRRPMVTVIRPSRARCVEGRIPRRERAVLTARHPWRRGRTSAQRSARFTSSRSGETMCGRAVFSEGVAARSITANLLRGAQHVGPRAGSLPRQDRGPDSRGASRAAVGEHIEVIVIPLARRTAGRGALEDQRHVRALAARNPRGVDGCLASERIERRLTAILAADIAGYSRLVEVDEEGTLSQWKALWGTVIEPKIKQHRGRIVRVIGDGILAEFASVIDAVRCAVEVQRSMAEHNANAPQDKRIEFRVGINFGELIIEGGDFWGDGVNIVARLEAL